MRSGVKSSLVMPLVVPALLLLVGCGSTPGTPISTTSSPSMTSSHDAPQSSAAKAPEVQHPLFPAKFTKTPCSMLSTSQLQTLGITNPDPPSVMKTGAGSGCTWSQHHQFYSFDVAFRLENTGGLSDVYSLRPEDKYFIPTTVSGYPAVFNGVLKQNGGHCNLDVGVNDHLVFFSQTRTSDQPSLACPLAKRVAVQVIKTLKGGS